jgi:DNA-binding winged helix-turn-helix (wHTH) protein
MATEPTDARTDPDLVPSRPNPTWLYPTPGAAQEALRVLEPDVAVLMVPLDGRMLTQASDESGAWQGTLAKALLALTQGKRPAEVLHGPDDLELHVDSRLAYCSGQELHLTSTEFALLRELLSRDGAVADAEDLSRAVWGHGTLGAPNYVEAHISRLRRKLRELGATRTIETVRGAGYRVRRPPQTAPAPIRQPLAPAPESDTDEPATRAA